MWGLFGRPFVDLGQVLDLTALDALDAEVSRGLAHVETTYTGGTLKWMGVVAPWAMEDAYLDAMHVIEALPDAELETFFSLADDPSALRVSERAGHRFGDETDHPFNRAQERWLAYRHHVYFPWKVYFELIPNRYWTDKDVTEGKDFTRLAKAVFPKTIAFLKRLPFSAIGRCNVMGLEANDHGTVHRDGERQRPEPDQFIALCPAANKLLYLWDEPGQRKYPVRSRAYWFNDNDYHGVEPAPYFRYSLRVDGRFTPEFWARLTSALETSS